MKIELLNNYVAVKLKEPKTVSQNGIIIQSDDNKPQTTGEIIAVASRDSNSITSLLRPGKIVMFQPHGLDIFEYDGEKVGIVEYKNIIGVVN